MYKRVIALFAVVTVLMSVAAVANAQETEAKGVGSARGYGWVSAKESGTAILDGRGIVHMAIDGDVVIFDYAGDAVVKAGAVPEEEPDGAGAQMQDVSLTSTYTFDNFRGRLHITGSAFRIEAEGQTKFRGHGKGVVEVEGRGWWKTLHRRGTWNGATLNIGDEAAG